MSDSAADGPGCLSLLVVAALIWFTWQQHKDIEQLRHELHESTNAVCEEVIGE